ncbi:MAG: flagellar hook-associated protein FlgK [Novosphingobium sp.]
MASDLLSIARSGTMAARIALDVTAQNIANAGTEGYVRRTARMAEVSSSGGICRIGDVSLSGVRLDKVVRNADLFRQSEVRRTGADAARADSEVTGLENIEAAVEQSRVYPAMVDFDGSLQRLAGDPTDASLRAGVMEAARTMAGTFNIAAQSLNSAASGMQFEATAGVAEVNTLTGELARVNLRLSRAADASSDQSSLLDQRDSLLQQISAYADVTTSFSADGTVALRLGGTNGQDVVLGGSATPLAMTTASDGTLSFDVGGNGITLTGGSLAGKQQALVKLADVRTRLDAVADGLMNTVNTAQTGGSDVYGNPGLPLFSGSGAGGMSLAFSDGSGLATAPAGSGPGSRNPGNLDALGTALGAADPTGRMDALIFDISGTVASRKVTKEALTTIASGAKISLEAQAGVDLDQEAVNLMRFQQAFQASGKAMQVASTLFDTLLNLR